MSSYSSKQLMTLRHRSRISLRPKHRLGIYALPKRAFSDGVKHTTFLKSLLTSHKVFDIEKEKVRFDIYYTPTNWWYFHGKTIFKDN
jgi:hypothetical protein